MDWTETVRKAAALAEEQGYITFDELNGLIEQQKVDARDIESLMEALSVEGIRIEEDDRTSKAGRALSCSFCGKAQSDVLQLIAGPQSFICNECVQLCVGVISNENPGWLEQHRQFLATLPLKPKS